MSQCTLIKELLPGGAGGGLKLGGVPHKHCLGKKPTELFTCPSWGEWTAGTCLPSPGCEAGQGPSRGGHTRPGASHLVDRGGCGCPGSNATLQCCAQVPVWGWPSSAHGVLTCTLMVGSVHCALPCAVCLWPARLRQWALRPCSLLSSSPLCLPRLLSCFCFLEPRDHTPLDRGECCQY